MGALKLRIHGTLKPVTWIREGAIRRLPGALVKMGPVYVKFGQLLSTRGDLVSKSVALSLRDLQSDISPSPFADVMSILMEDLNTADIGTIFSEFDEVPFASASIGQVHLARVRSSGTRVAVKIQRPGIKEDFYTDLRRLEFLSNFLSLVLKERETIELAALVKELKRCICSETDFKEEASNMKAFGTILNKRDSSVRVPRVVTGLTNSRVLTMEYIHSEKVTELRAVPDLKRERVPVTLMRSLSRLMLEDGYVHCDPHPGNVGVTRDGVIVLYDFGMVARLSVTDRHVMRNLGTGLMFRSVKNIGDVALSGELIRAKESGAVSFINMNENEKLVFERLCVHLFEYIDTMNMPLCMERVANDENIDINKIPFELNDSVSYMIKSFSILEGVCRELDSSFNYPGLLLAMAVDTIVPGDIIDRGVSDINELLRN